MVKKKKEQKTVKFTRAELKWIERTADIESSMAMLRFFDLVKSVDINKLSGKEKEMIQKMSSEYIELYLFLKELRIKLELWDCRFDIDTKLKQEGGNFKRIGYLLPHLYDR